MTTQKPGDRQVFHTLDGIRGIAALIVVLWHTADMFGVPRPHRSYLAVDLFFLLSGAVISKSYETRLTSGGLGLRDFAVVRIVRLYPLYLAGSLVTMAALIIGLGPHYKVWEAWVLALLAASFLPNLIIGNPKQLFPFNFPAWSLFYELLSNYVYGAFVRALSNRVLWAIILPCWVGIVLAVTRLPDHNLNIGFTMKSIPLGIVRSFFSFFAGVLLYRHFRQTCGVSRINHGPAQVGACCIFLLVALVLLASPPEALAPAYDVFCVTLAFPALVCAGLLCQPTGLVQKFCSISGSLSYTIYAIHDPLAHLIERMNGQYHFLAASGSPLGLITFFAALILGGLALEKFYDLPARRWLTSLLTKQKPAATAPQNTPGTSRQRTLVI